MRIRDGCRARRGGRNSALGCAVRIRLGRRRRCNGCTAKLTGRSRPFAVISAVAELIPRIALRARADCGPYGSALQPMANVGHHLDEAVMACDGMGRRGDRDWIDIALATSDERERATSVDGRRTDVASRRRVDLCVRLRLGRRRGVATERRAGRGAPMRDRWLVREAGDRVQLVRRDGRGGVVGHRRGGGSGENGAGCCRRRDRIDRLNRIDRMDRVLAAADLIRG